MEKIHYVYRLEHLDTKEYYIGSRTCEVHPTLDSYMGSMLSWKPDKKRLKKTIILSDFKSREECMLFERTLIIQSYKDVLNKNAHIPGVGFETTNTVVVKDVDTGKCFRIYKEDPLLKSGKVLMFWEGRTHTKKTKKKMRKSALTRTITVEGEKKRRDGISKNNKKPKSEEHIKNISKAKLGENNPMYGVVSNMNGKHYEKLKCKHCGKEVSRTKIEQFHNDNCKSIRNP